MKAHPTTEAPSGTHAVQRRLRACRLPERLVSAQPQVRALAAMQRLADTSAPVRRLQDLALVQRVEGDEDLHTDHSLRAGVEAHPRQGVSEPSAAAGASGDPAVQLKRYSVRRDLKLEKGIKTFEASKEEKGKKGKPDKPGLSAKTRAKGEFLAALRSEYPLPESAEALDFDAQEKARGEGYLAQKRLVEQEFSKVDDDARQVDVYRPAIKEGASDAKRSGGTQAGPVSALTGKTYIGAHLVKREWGGEDNMWNVVAWPKDTAEDKWAESFESPVDKAGLWGLDPGTVSISVTKEDDLVPKLKLDTMIEGAIRKQMKTADLDSLNAEIERSLDPHFMDPVNTERQKLNRAVESVPIEATGTNRAPNIKTGEVVEATTTLSSTETAYDLAAAKAKEAMARKVDLEIVKSKNDDDDADRTRHPRAAKPERLRDADARETGKRSEERRKAWQQEVDAYGAGFETHNGVT